MRKAYTNGEEKTGRKLRKKILNNLGLKLLSVVLAIVFWFLVVMADNPKDSVSFSNIQVNLINTELLEKGNKFYEVLEGSDRIRVTVEAPRNVIQELNASDIVAEADVSRLTEVNTVPISFRILNDEIEILDITGSRDAVRLNVEEKASKWVNVNCDTRGEVAEGYIIGSTKLDQTRLEITGPQSVVESIKYAGIEIDVTGAVTNVSGNADVHFYDTEGALVDDSDIVKNANIMHVEVQVLATKEVPVEVSYSGTAAEGYVATGQVECDPASVMIAGTASALAEINKITIPERELDITEATENVEKVIDIRKYLDNASLADSSFNGRVTVTVHIEPVVERNLVIPQGSISVINLPEGYEWEFAEEQQTYRLRISGLESAVAAVNQSEVRGTIDVGAWMTEEDIQELTSGVHEIQAVFTLPDDVNIRNEISVRLNINKLEEE
nr:CdaR family protein [uncultured Acetatifactor sp.]